MSEPKKSIRALPPDAKRGWVHFGIVAFILAGTWAGWNKTREALGWATEKEPVPWPEQVKVNGETSRLESFPDEVGEIGASGSKRFVLVPDGEFRWLAKDDLPDGEIFLDDTVKEILGIGTSFDKERFDARSSNWHIVREYRDNTRSVGDPLRYWRLEVCYYTGRLDTVPHVPERCLKAGGAIVTSSRDVTFNVPGLLNPWDVPVQFRRIDAERTDDYGVPHQSVTYYTFSLNGDPESSWEKVRFTLTLPWIRHCYFAKIQFGPKGYLSGTVDIDTQAEDFAKNFLPLVLQALPTPTDIEALRTPQTPME